MKIVCLDMEGVLTPEIWIAFADEIGIPELRRTTRDEPDYDKLMRWRIDLLRSRGIKLAQIQDTIARIDPLPGAKEFLDELRSTTQVLILSDTFDQFAMPLMKKLGYPTLLCNTLKLDAEGYITRHVMRCEHSKLTTVKALQSIGYTTIASGDSLQRPGYAAVQQGGLPVPRAGKDQAGLPADQVLRGIRRVAVPHPGGAL